MVSAICADLIVRNLAEHKSAESEHDESLPLCVLQQLPLVVGGHPCERQQHEKSPKSKLYIHPAGLVRAGEGNFMKAIRA